MCSDLINNTTIMKKIFYILLLLPLSIIGQETIAPEMFQTYNNTGANETFMFAQDYIDVFQSEQTMNGILAAFYDLNGDGEIGYYNSSSGMLRPECVGYTNITQGNQTALAVWGDDTTTDEIDGLPCGEVPTFYFLSELNVIYEIQLSGFLNGVYQNEDQLYTCGDPESDYYCEYIGYGYCTNDLLVPENISLLCLNDTDGDGVCDEDEIDAECGDSEACNYVELDSTTDINNDLCTYPFANAICSTCEDGAVVIYDADNDGLCDAQDTVFGCTDEDACNYNNSSTVNTDNSLCVYLVVYCDACSGDQDGSGTLIDNDLDDDDVCDDDEIVGCQDQTADNYDVNATDSGDCIYSGCSDYTACNFNENANADDGTCMYTDGVCDSCEDGFVIDNDVDNDGICNADEVEECTDDTACNYNDDDTSISDNTLCIYAEGCDSCSGETDGSGALVNNDADNDGVCNDLEIAGCTQENACNYDYTATDEDGNCVFSALYYNCSGDCSNDEDNDSVCDENEIPGCTDDTAINYNESATDDDDTCEYEGAGNCTLPNPFVLNTGANMTVALTSTFVSSLNISEENAYLVALTSEGMVVGTINLFGLSQTMLAIWGDDTSTENLDGALAGEIISFQMVYGTSLFNVEMPTPVSYTTNGMSVQTSPATLTDACLIYICSDPNYLEYYFNPTEIDLQNENTEELCGTPITSTGLTADMFTDPINTGANMTLPMPGGLLEQFSGGQIAAFMGDVCVGLESITTGFIAMGLWGDDSSTELIDGLLVGEVPTFAVLYNGGVISLDQNEMTGYQTNGIAPISNFQFTEPIGCTNPAACNYLSYALIDDGSCILPIEFYNCNNSCINDTDNDGICDELEIPGCTEWGYNNYNEVATDNDGSCTVSWEDDYTNLSLSSNAIIDSIETDYTNYITNSTATIDSLQAAYDQLDGLSISIDLLLGWNIIGYTNSYEQDAEEALFAIEDLIEVFKDNNADVYMPEYGFNGIGNLVPGQGYQIKVSEAYNSFSFENTPIFGCTYENSINYNPIALIDDGTCITIVFGCTDTWSENYNPYATINDGSCFYYICYDPFCGNTLPISFDPWCQWMLNDFSTDPIYSIDGYEFNDYIDDESLNDGAIYGCTDPEASNYNSSANSYDGTCTYP